MKIYFKKLARKQLFYATLLMVFVVSSCSEDILEETPLDFLAPENAYNSVAGIRQGVYGLHFSVRDTWYNGNPDAASYPLVIMLGSLGTDFAFFGENPGGNARLVNYQSEMTSQNTQFSFFWDNSYEIVQRANVLIDGINSADSTIWVDAAEKNSYLAEARFFRAYTYAFLVPLYGDVPLSTEPIQTVKNDFVRTPKAEIYQQIEEDLLFAAEYLPAPGTEEAPGRITQGAAWHKLAEVYNSQEKYQEAVDAASKVIDGGYYHLMTERFGSTNDVFGTGDVFLDLFAFGNHNSGENKEAIWVIQIEPLVRGGNSFAGERAWGPAYYRLGNTPDSVTAFRGELYQGNYTGYTDTLGRPVAWVRPTNYTAYDIWRSDWDNDIRNAEHNIKRNFYYDNPESAYNGQKVDFSLYPEGTRDALRDTCQYIFPFYMKHADPLNHFTEPNRSGGGYTHKDVYAIRLAETILLRAEAYVGLGNQAAAAADINLIRARANATLVAPAQVDLDYILDERARELYAEEFRHITLRRMGKLLERVRKYNNNPVYPACNIQDYNVLWPIPQSEIDLNINGELTQNPGY